MFKAIARWFRKKPEVPVRAYPRYVSPPFSEVTMHICHCLHHVEDGLVMDVDLDGITTVTVPTKVGLVVVSMYGKWTSFRTRSITVDGVHYNSSSEEREVVKQAALWRATLEVKDQTRILEDRLRKATQ